MIKYIDCEVGGRFYQDVEFKNMGFSFKNIEWTLWDKITLPFYKFKRVSKDCWYYFIRMCVRINDGYDARDVFSLDYSFVIKYENIFKDFRKYNNGVPYGLKEDEWNKILDEMIYHLHYMDENNIEDELQFYVKDEENSYIIAGRTVFEIMEEHRKEFFELFSKYFYSLWY